MDTSIQGIRSDIEGQNAYMQEIFLHIRKYKCFCLCGNLEQQNKDPRYIKPYTLGQDVFQLHHQINLTSETSEGIYGMVSDIVMMDDGRLVICLPDQWRLLICNTDESQIDSIDVLDRPVSVSAVNNSTVAVTLFFDKCLEMYDVNNKYKLKSISVPGMLWRRGITTINNKLVVCGENRLLMIDHQTGEVVQKIKTHCDPYKLHGSGDRIFYCNSYYNNKLYWYSYIDDRHYTITLPSQPRRMTTLRDGSLYVRCKDGLIQHVSSDGKLYKTVTTKGLIDCLAYNPKQRQLVTKTKNQRKFNVFYEK